ncbi:MAG: hypothetical protein ABIJ56_09755, partial [Pseudomonadota bacterium]
AHIVIPALPAGSIVLVSAMLGWMPTGIDVSVWHSLWAFEHGKAWGCRPQEEMSLERRKSLLSKSLLDMRTGYGLSVLLGIMFYVLGTKVPSGAATAPDGAKVALAITDAYTSILGQWVLPFLLAAIFFGMFSTTYVVLDGFPRAFARSLKVLFSGPESESKTWDRVYRISMVVVWAAVVVILIVVPRPVFLTTSAAVLSFILAPLLCFFNYYCVTRHITEESLRPSPVNRVIALCGILFMTAASVLFIVFCVVKT